MIPWQLKERHERNIEHAEKWDVNISRYTGRVRDPDHVESLANTLG